MKENEVKNGNVVINVNEIKNGNNFKDNCLKYTPSIYLWYPVVLLIITVTTILCFVYSQNNATKDHLNKIVEKIKIDSTKYKLDSLTNHRLITLEIKQSSYSDNISFYSIFISAFITVLVVIIGLSVYFNNKENVEKLETKHIIFDKKQQELEAKYTEFDKKQQELEAKHSEFDKKQEDLDNVIKRMRKEQTDLTTYIDYQTSEINKIVDEQKYFHFEIFNNLYLLNHQQYEMWNTSKDFVFGMISLSNSWTYLNIFYKNLPQNRLSTYKKSYNLNDLLNNLELEINNESKFLSDDNFVYENKEFIILNMMDSLNFIEDNLIKIRVQNLIDKISNYKTNNEHYKDNEEENTSESRE